MVAFYADKGWSFKTDTLVKFNSFRTSLSVFIVSTKEFDGFAIFLLVFDRKITQWQGIFPSHSIPDADFGYLKKSISQSRGSDFKCIVILWCFKIKPIKIAGLLHYSFQGRRWWRVSKITQFKLTHGRCEKQVLATFSMGDLLPMLASFILIYYFLICVCHLYA